MWSPSTSGGGLPVCVPYNTSGEASLQPCGNLLAPVGVLQPGPLQHQWEAACNHLGRPAPVGRSQPQALQHQREAAYNHVVPYSTSGGSLYVFPQHQRGGGLQQWGPLQRRWGGSLQPCAPYKTVGE
ncbi:hypothetical protein Hamer_G031675 [Homarus americanus]|uniref:Uncharacterized protein n=1 Tax=Homarus americanus TaxID=6706 RepID=A0A8J5MUR2_HOMAM|nr:hypothetical protein Hamer_G031675 [Homarus americanus]